MKPSATPGGRDERDFKDGEGLRDAIVPLVALVTLVLCSGMAQRLQPDFVEAGPGVIARQHAFKWIRETEKQLFAFFLEGVGKVFEEDEAKADMLVLRSIHVPAHLVGGSPKLRFKP